IVTDILPSKNAEVNFKSSLKKINRFTKTILAELPAKKLLVLQKDYAKNPIVGIGQAPSFLNPFSDDFVYETRFIKAYLASYLNELLVINKRKDHWITGGIQTYVMMKFVEAFYPGSKFLGDLNKIKILGLTLFKPYSAAQIGFNESFSFMAEFTEHANNQQEDILSKDELTKSNESYAIPYHTGSGLYYLDKYLGDQILEESIKEFSIERGSRSLKKVIAAHTPKETQWFFDTYLTDREAFDLSIKNVIKAPNAIRFTVSEKNAKSLPYKLDLIKDNEIIKEEWIFHSGKDSILQLNPGEADFIALNSNRFLPEKNRRNNWKYLQSASGLKPLRLTFYGDSEDLKRNQLFYHPISDFNVYDGFTAGMRIYNTRLKNQPFEIDFHPQYSIKENALVGFFRTRYRFMNHDSKNYQNQVFITGRSYHYNTNLRYTSLQPSFSMYFRPLDLRSNKRQFFNISWYNVFRDRDPEIQVTPDYSVLSMLHRYNNSDAVDVFTTNSNLEISNKFGKIYFSTNYRKLYPSGRQFSLRFFAGKFLWHNTTETQFFDFNLNRSPDYLFRYDYLGRSEDTGIYSQQFVPAEGGFKSFFNESSANDYMASINGSIGIWKWIEFYGDVGILRNQNRPAVTYFDSGIKLSLVPDYFELFFPLYSSNGFDLTQPGYDTKIRFIFTPRLSTLSSLFTRKWF
ncbi:MAG: metalloprotease, partial [Flavobacteriaceae bacterium]